MILIHLFERVNGRYIRHVYYHDLSTGHLFLNEIASLVVTASEPPFDFAVHCNSQFYISTGYVYSDKLKKNNEKNVLIIYIRNCSVKQ